jgi:hypothetical protein
MVAGIAAAVLVTAVVWRNSGRVGADAARLPAPEVRHVVDDVVPAAEAAAHAVPEAVPAVNSADAGRVARTSAPLVFSLHATGDVWLAATADGERRAYRLFAAGEDLSLDARKQIALRVGDASAVTYTINGASGRALGGRGIVRDLVITPDDYTAFVDAAR